MRHWRTMLFVQFSGLNSLREIEQRLAAHRSGLYHLNLRSTRRSTLSDAQSHQPEAVFRDICQTLMRQGKPNGASTGGRVDPVDRRLRYSTA